MSSCVHKHARRCKRPRNIHKNTQITTKYSHPAYYNNQTPFLPTEAQATPVPPCACTPTPTPFPSTTRPSPSAPMASSPTTVSTTTSAPSPRAASPRMSWRPNSLPRAPPRTAPGASLLKCSSPAPLRGTVEGFLSVLCPEMHYFHHVLTVFLTKFLWNNMYIRLRIWCAIYH